MRKITYKDITPEMKRIAEPIFNESTRSSVGMESFMGEYYFIDVQRLIPYHKQARKIFKEDEIENLAQTIKEHGIRQPLTILKVPEEGNLFEVISGERRLRAAKLIGLKKVPCIIIEDVRQAAEIALIENIQREDLHPIEFARSVNNLILNSNALSQSEIAKRIGVSKSHLSESLKLLELDDEILNLMLENDVRGREHFRKLFNLTNNNDRLIYLNKLLKINSQENSKEFFSRSILRITINDKGLKVQKSQLEKLNPLQIQEVIKTLQEIIKEYQ